MLRNSDLFVLIKSLDLHERRYLVKTGRGEFGQGNAYVEILKSFNKLDQYSEASAKSIIGQFSDSEKTEVKKHYLFYWILKRLHDYHSARYKGISEINHIRVLMDRSLYQTAIRIIPAIKKRLIDSENYPEILMLLEMELRISMYSEKSNPVEVFEEVQVLSQQYADLKTLQLIRFRMRRILDSNIFIRNEADKKAMDEITSQVNRLSPGKNAGRLLQYNYNLIMYWKYATVNEWTKAFPFALRNYQLMCTGDSQIRKFPDETIHSYFNLLNASLISERPTHARISREFRKMLSSTLLSRVKHDTYFYFHLSSLINFNRNFQSIPKTGIIEEALNFIKSNRKQISRTRLNNFYFDLAKSLFYVKDYKVSFSMFNDIYQNLNVPGHTRDFYTHSRILFCLSCFESNEIDLMRYAAKSLEEYMKRNAILYRFEKRFVGFIVRDLFRFEIMRNAQIIKRLEQLSTDIQSIFESPFERTVLNYFDYTYWINLKLSEHRK